MSGKRRAAGPASTKTPPRKPPTKGKGKGGKPGKPPRSRLRRVLFWTGITALTALLLGAVGFYVLYRSIDIPKENEAFLTETSFVYYSDGKSELGRFAEQNRDSIPLDEMPQHLQDAVVAAENRTFWSDRGIDPRGIVRAAFSNASGGTTQGASTITQQYVKILYLSQEQTYTRKAKEAILSLKLHREKSKREILEGYLNTIYFGRSAYGVQAAARAYFDKPASQLTLRESVVLARVLNNPGRYDPANGKDAREELKAGYDHILDGMAEMGTITAEEAEKAKRRLPKFPKIEAESTYGGQKGHVLSMVRQELLRLGFTDAEIDGGGLRVTTTFQSKVMRALEQGVVEVRPKFPGSKHLHVGAASVQPGTGAVRGIYGGQDFLDSQINWSVSGGQGGSILKPFALVAGLREGFSLNDTFEGNSPIEVGDTEFENQGDQDYGRVNLIKATEDSINTAFIDLTDALDSGPDKVIEAAHDMGLPPKDGGANYHAFPRRTPGLEPNTGVALGSATVSPINMANAYGTLANEGVAAEAFIIERVVDADGVEVYRHKVKDREAVDPDIAADVTYALQQVVNSGSGARHGRLDDRPAAGKTGTSTNDEGDVVSSWYTGFTPQLATSVVYVRGKGTEKLDDWLPDFEGSSGYFGGGYPAATWAAAMTRALEGTEVLEFPPPAWVDGEAPSTGHEPWTPEPQPTKSQQPESTRTPKPTRSPTQPQTSEPPPPPPPSPTVTDCAILGNCPPSDDPTTTGGPGPTGPTTGPGGGNGDPQGRRRRE